MNEMERRTSSRYARGKEVRRRGYARYRFLRGSRSSSGGRVRVGVGHGEVDVGLPVIGVVARGEK